MISFFFKVNTVPRVTISMMFINILDLVLVLKSVLTDSFLRSLPKTSRFFLFCIMLVTELVSTMWDTHVTLHCGHYSTQTYDAHDWSVASQTLLGPIKISPVVCKICIEQPILCAKLTSSINYLLYWLWLSVSHISTQKFLTIKRTGFFNRKIRNAGHFTDENVR